LTRVLKHTIKTDHQLFCQNFKSYLRLFGTYERER